MARPRAVHVAKTEQDFREYLETTIREAGPTVDEIDFAEDATDTPGQSAATPSYSQSSSRRQSWLRQHRDDLLKALIVAGIVGFVSWFAYQTYSINREVGELSSTVKAINEDQEDTHDELVRIEDRLQRDVDLNTSRIDRLADRPPQAAAQTDN